MKYCIHCGKGNSDEARFCGHCGKEITDNPTEEEGERRKTSGRPAMAAFFSAIFPGIGQLYNGRFIKGVLVASIGIFLLTREREIMLVTSFFYVFLWVYGIIDAWYGAKERATE